MSERFRALVDLMAALRAPDGCPWDRKQTHESLKPYLLEETYEVLEILDRQDHAKLPEELGDVLLQVLFHSQIAAEAGSFTIEDVLEPYLIQQGYLQRTPRGRMATVSAYRHFGLAQPQAAGTPELWTNPGQ